MIITKAEAGKQLYFEDLSPGDVFSTDFSEGVYMKLYDAEAVNLSSYDSVKLHREALVRHVYRNANLVLGE